MKTDKMASSANTPQKRPVGRKPQTVRRSRWFLSRVSLMNFGVLVILFTAVALIHQFSQKPDQGEEKPAEVSAQVQIEPAKEEPKKIAVKKFAATNRISRDSLLQKKRSVAWGDFIPFEKK